MLDGLPKEIEEYMIDAEEKCSVCGGELKVIGKEIVRTEVEFKPATLIVKQIVRHIAKCKSCSSDGNDRPAHIQKASVPAKVLPHSIATHSLVAQIMYQKFGMGAPFARQEKDFCQMGLEISRALLDAFWSWVENTITIPTTNEKLTKALNYSLNHKKELAEMPNADFCNHPEIIDYMLPWSDKLPKSYRLIHKHKKSFKK